MEQQRALAELLSEIEAARRQWWAECERLGIADFLAGRTSYWDRQTLQVIEQIDAAQERARKAPLFTGEP